MDDKQDLAEIERRLGAFWDCEPEGFEGCFYKIRMREFNENEINEYIAYLSNVDFTGHEALPRYLVSLLWFTPIFLEWNRHNVKPELLDAYDKARDKIISLLLEEKRLGVA